MERDMRSLLGDPFLKEAFSPAQKRQIRESQNNCCAMCGGSSKKRQLEVHHKLPSAMAGSDESSNGVGLCRQDHIIANRMIFDYGISFESLLQFINGKT